jgi:hypothetical protein
MPDYSKGLIYKLCCKDANITDIYIGSTTNFKQRKRAHKTHCNNEKCKSYNLKLYKCIRENGGWDNWNMIQIKTVNANDKRELETEERVVFEELKPTLNNNIPSRTSKEWSVAYYEANRDDIISKQKAYSEANRDAILEKKKSYREANRDAIRERDRAYYKKKREAIRPRKNAYMKAYRQRKKEEQELN